MHEFLCLGCACGYWTLQVLGLCLDITKPAYDQIMEDATLTGEAHLYVREATAKQELLAMLSERMNLTPWTNVNARLDELEQKYLDLLDAPE